MNGRATDTFFTRRNASAVYHFLTEMKMKNGTKSGAGSWFVSVWRRRVSVLHGVL